MRPAITFLNIQLSNSRDDQLKKLKIINFKEWIVIFWKSDKIPSLTVEKQKNGCKASKINACSRFLFRNDMCYCAIFFTLW